MDFKGKIAVITGGAQGIDECSGLYLEPRL